MKVAVFSTKPYDRRFLDAANRDAHSGAHQIEYFEPRLELQTAPLAEGFDAVCAFVNDILDRPVLETLARGGTTFIAMRCAGFNNVDLDAARELGLTIARVPAYSPHAVAEHAVAMLLTLNRKTHRAFNRVREGNFALEGLLGFDLFGKTVGVVGAGKIGLCFIRIMLGFGCRVLVFEPFPSPDLDELPVEMCDIDRLMSESDVISLHCPLTPENRHLINADSLAHAKPGALLINTSRGGLVDTRAVVDALKSGVLGGVALDVYEDEAALFFEDRSGEVIPDDLFARLQVFPNVLITGHQAFFTHEALENIASTTIRNLSDGVEGRNLVG